MEVVYTQHTLHAGAGGYGALMAFWGAGAVAGSAVYARWRRHSAAALISAAAGLLGIGFAIMTVAPSLAVAVLGAAVAGAGNSAESIASRTAVQDRTPDRWMALTMSLADSISQLAPGLGILLGGVIAALTMPRVAIGVAAVGSLVFAAAVRIALREPEGGEEPSGAEAEAEEGANSRSTSLV